VLRQRKRKQRTSQSSPVGTETRDRDDPFVFAFARLTATARSSSTEQFSVSLNEVCTIAAEALAAAIDLLVAIIRVIVEAWGRDVDDYCGTRRRFSLLELD
jgi:hypothetical protein